VNGPPKGELATLRTWLDDFRGTVERKTEDLDAEQLARRSVPPSSLSLLGLVRHLAQMEHHWFSRVLRQSGEAQLFVVDGNWDSQFDDAVADPGMVEEAFSTWRAVTGDADSVLDHLDDGYLDADVDPGDRISTVRDVLVQVIQEYARHCGHMDLLRECIDGRTGQ
jgi:uncharacterized damage-inducible protein DinB